MDKFVFLDIDGVLNSEQYYLEKPQHKRWKEFKNKLDKHIAWGVCNIDPKAVKLLNKLVSGTNARIVVSSSWRGDYALQTVFSLAGIIEPIYGETPRLESRFRGEEIDKWLKERQEPYKYVILDDDSDMLDTQRNNFIHTDWKVGLTEENVNEAIKILNNDNSKRSQKENLRK